MTFDCYHIERELRIARTMLSHASTLEQRDEAHASLQYWQKRAELMYADDGVEIDADDADMLTWQAGLQHRYVESGPESEPIAPSSLRHQIDRPGDVLTPEE